MANDSRAVARAWMGKPTLEGAGVHLRRGFGSEHVPALDPFLMFDDFRNDDPSKYLPGFPWHPHRGIETITYVLEGEVDHGDSMGNSGTIAAGDVQWMTAGSGIIHQEMPRGDSRGRMGGFQLWANLPASHKMMAPRYRGLTRAEIPETALESGTTVRLIAGSVDGVTGPVTDIVTDPEYLDVTVPPGTAFRHPVESGHTALAYVIAGSACFGPDHDGASERVFGSGYVVLYDREGSQVSVTAGDAEARFLLISGRPLGEPIAWRGPIVMNTEEELRVAFEEYRNGTFIKHG